MATGEWEGIVNRFLLLCEVFSAGGGGDIDPVYAYCVYVYISVH